ncbi:glycosyl transferase family 2 [Pantoea wallisii]|uniref:Glycosyl transferase family 2 n=1 Tax=Pantoea wallisii TaxID=1076551 RepID=A0A1X1DBQ5_9GAMM|nr:glycosyltransferase [Pantoea wallisii]ORM74173.1 glycosyl transferase family 2 [Pantoea wallisii]
MDNPCFISVVLPVYNEAARINAVMASILQQRSPGGLFSFDNLEVIMVDNNSTDNSVALITAFAAQHPQLRVHLLHEAVQGVSSARKKGMDFASQRAGARDEASGYPRKHYILSADADCTVDDLWIDELVSTMIAQQGDLGTCNYYYETADFHERPRLYSEIEKTLRCRHASFSLFGGFPDGKGFAVEKQLYDKVGGIEIFCQLKNGEFVEHLSDDWDFGIKVIAAGGKPVYAPHSRVQINSRRVDNLLHEVIEGVAYGHNGTIIMKDVRPALAALTPFTDVTPEQAQQAWDYSIKDYVPKNLVLPVLLNPSLLRDNTAVIDFFTPAVAEQMYARIHCIMQEMSVTDFLPIHSYKTPAFRLYFEFHHALFAALRRAVGEDIGAPPPLPACFARVAEEDFSRFVWYYCEDRESGEAHNYFANGGVF